MKEEFMWILQTRRYVLTHLFNNADARQACVVGQRNPYFIWKTITVTTIKEILTVKLNYSKCLLVVPQRLCQKHSKLHDCLSATQCASEHFIYY